MSNNDELSLAQLTSQLEELDSRPVIEHIDFYESVYAALVNEFSALGQ